LQSAQELASHLNNEEEKEPYRSKTMFGAKLNRQPGTVNENALQMLRDKGLKKYSEVQTADGQLLGNALRLRLRQDEVDADLKLYAAYLEVASLDLGTHFYVPTDFVRDYDPEQDQVTLSVPFSTVQDESWNREPTFIAGHQEEIEALAE
jgi:hypothetical protein